ncbi:MAG: flagellar motor switch protein FliG [Phycisphaerales bacterium]|nr:MAG: flagellar motor switch protein FliG [Phycisphaerales bacterium]
MLALKPEVGSQILKHMDRDNVEELSRQITTLGDVDLTTMNSVVEEFYSEALNSQFLDPGGLGYAAKLINHTFPKEEAKRIIEQLEQLAFQQPFSFLQRTESENLLTFIQDEHPQTIALILAHLMPSKGSEILVALPAAKQVEVVKRIAQMEQTDPMVIREVERGLENRLAGIVGQRLQRAGGVEAVAEMLNLADRATEKGILESLESDDPDLVEDIRRLMFVFEDILLVNDRGIQAVLKEVDNDELALALKTASPELKEKIFKNMSERAATLIQEDMEYMGPVRISDVEAAQQRIVDVVRRLEDAGEIIIAGRGGEKEMIV